MFPNRKTTTSNAQSGEDDPPIAFNQTPIQAPYIAAAAAAVPSERLVPYTSSATTVSGLTPVLLPGSRSVPNHAASASSATGRSEPTTVGSTNTEQKTKKKKKKERPQSIEAVLVPESKSRAKQKGQNFSITLVSQANAITTPPAFLFPIGAMNLPDISLPGDSRKNWKLSGKLSNGCKVLNHLDGPETSRLHELFIPVESSEIVLYVSAKKENNGNVMAMHIENNTLSDMALTRNHRSAILTRGSLQFKKPSFSITACLVFLKEKVSPNINISLFDLRGIHVGDSSSNVVIVAYRKQQQHDETIRYVVYQTPNTGRFILPLAKSVVAAYTGVPQWAIPISWSGKLPPLPSIPQYEHKAWMGTDGGFSSSVYAATMAYHVKHKVSFENFKHGSGLITAHVQKQQLERRRSSVVVPQSIAPLDLAVTLGALYKGSDRGGIVFELLLAALNALSFNLIFRKLELTKARFDQYDNETIRNFRNSLGRALLYNVTLREVNFESSNLSEFGETIGNAWAMNGKNQSMNR
jgi:hypothetical protein